MNDKYRDRLDIIEMFNRYAIALDDRRWDMLAGLFAPEATAEMPEGTPLLVGREAIVGMVTAAIEGIGPTHHTLSNHLIEIDGDRAEACCHLRAYHAGRGQHADKFEESLGQFKAKLVRTPEGWRFTWFLERIMIMLGTAEIFDPNLRSDG